LSLGRAAGSIVLFLLKKGYSSAVWDREERRGVAEMLTYAKLGGADRLGGPTADYCGLS
jgi:hypothetical protein